MRCTVTGADVFYHPVVARRMQTGPVVTVNTSGATHTRSVTIWCAVSWQTLHSSCSKRHWGPCFAGKIESNLHLPHMCDTWILRNTWVSSLHLSSEFWSRNMSTRGLRPFGGTTLNHHTDIGKLNTTPCRSTYRYLSCIYSIFGDLKDIRM